MAQVATCPPLVIPTPQCSSPPSNYNLGWPVEPAGVGGRYQNLAVVPETKARPGCRGGGQPRTRSLVSSSLLGKPVPWSPSRLGGSGASWSQKSLSQLLGKPIPVACGREDPCSASLCENSKEHLTLSPALPPTPPFTQHFLACHLAPAASQDPSDFSDLGSSSWLSGWIPRGDLAQTKVDRQRRCTFWSLWGMKEEGEDQ